MVVPLRVQDSALAGLESLVGHGCPPLEVLHCLLMGSLVPLLVVLLAPPLEIVHLVPVWGMLVVAVVLA